jgi:diguanylate cyclase (GGDEF)-like protein
LKPDLAPNFSLDDSAAQNHWVPSMLLGFDSDQEAEFRVYLFGLTRHRLRAGARMLCVVLLGFIIMDVMRLRSQIDQGQYALVTEILTYRILPLLFLLSPTAFRFGDATDARKTMNIAYLIYITLGVCTILVMLAYYRYPDLHLTPFSLDGIIILMQGVFFPLGLPFRMMLMISMLLMGFAFTAMPLFLPQAYASEFWRLMPFVLISWTVCAAAGYILDSSNRKQFLLKKKLQWAAERDSLTALFNRRMFDSIGARILAAGQREGNGVCLLTIDVDFFKAYNDRYGHPAGDSALAEVGQCMEGFARRDTDLAARLGGEEFALILYGSTLLQAKCRAEELRDAVASNLALEHSASQIANVLTVSIGVTQATPTDTMASLYKRADDALYQAKSTGRNRVIAQH